MPTKRSRDEDDEDDRPRRRRRDDDEDDDDRPRSRRRDEDDEDDDRPRRRRRDDDDEDDRRPARKPRRKSGGASTGKVLAIIGGVAAVIGVIVLVIFLVRGGLGGASISYAKFKAIGPSATLESLEKDFGKAKKLDRAEWSKIKYVTDDDFGGGGGFRGARAETLADLDSWGNEIDAWYHWHSGSEDIYVASGKDFNNKPGLVLKVYTNSNAMRENARAGGDISKAVPSYMVEPVR